MIGCKSETNGKFLLKALKDLEVIKGKTTKKNFVDRRKLYE